MEISGLQSPQPLVNTHQNGEDQESVAQIKKPGLYGQFNRNFHQLKMQKFIDTPILPISLQLKNEASSQQFCNFNTFKQNVRKVICHPVYDYLYITFLTIFMIACLGWDPQKNQSVTKVCEIIQLSCHGIFLVNIILHIVQWKKMRLGWLIMDIVTTGAGLAGIFIVDNQVARYFKAIRAIKLVFLIKQIQIFRQPASNLITALAKISSILIPAFAIIYVYTIIGLYAFKDYEYSKCRSIQNLNRDSNWTVYSEQVYLCGVKSCPIYNAEQLQCLNPIDYNVQPNEEQLLNMVQGNGLLRYSNFWYALHSTLKQTYVTGSSRLIILYKQATDQFFVQMYFFTYILLISYIYLNIFYSLIITTQWDNDEYKQLDIPLLQNENENENVTHKNRLTKKQSNNGKAKDIQPDQEQGMCSIDKINHKSPNQQIQIGQDKVVQIQVDGCLQVKKAKIFNIFENLQVESSGLQNLPSIQVEVKVQVQQQQEKWRSFNNKFMVFQHIIITMCCINLSLDYHKQPQQFKFVVDCIDFVFYVIFILETSVKIFLDVKCRNTLQAVTKVEILLVILCTIGIIIQIVMAKDMTDFFMASNHIDGVFRSFKYIRIILLILASSHLHQAKLILESIIRSVFKIRNVFGLWIVVVIIFSICGFHLHSYKTKVDKYDKIDMENGTGYQVSFDGIQQSLIFTFLTFYNQQWDYLMFQQYLGSGVLIVVWQFLSLTIGLILFSKYFMALLMKELDQIIDENEDKDKDQSFKNIIQKQQKESQSQIDVSKHNININRVNPSHYTIKFKSKDINFKQVHFVEALTNNQPLNNSDQKQVSLRRKVDTKQTLQNPDCKSSCLNKFSTLPRRMVEHTAYLIIWVLIIIASFLVLIQTHPHQDRLSPEIYIYKIIDYVCKAFFLFDLIINVGVYHICANQNAYLRKSWLNIVNVIIIVVEIVSFTAIGENQIFLKIQKVKVLRLLFFVELKYKYDWNMRMTFHSLLKLIPKSLSLLAITIVMYSYFALVLVKLYKDQFHHCQNFLPGAQIITKQDCMNWGGDWVQAIMNTSNIFSSILFLFLLATTEGWITLMQTVMNFVQPDYEPVLNSNYHISIFFVAFFFFGNLIMLNVFIGLSISNFKRLKEIATGQSKLSSNQRMWLGIKTQIYRLQPTVDLQRPSNAIRGYSFIIATSIVYKIVQGLCFIGFTVAMSLFSSNMNTSFQKSLFRLQQIFAIIYLLEYIIQFLAYGYRTEYKKSFIFKTLVIFYSLGFVIANQGFVLEKSTQRQLGSYFIALQLISSLFLLDQMPFAQKMMNSLMTIFPRATNIYLLLLTVLFIYAIVGMELFSFLRFGTQLDQFNQNYTSFGKALFALIKFSTMQSPIQQLSDAAQTLSSNFICQEIIFYSDFVKYGQMGCGSKFSSYFFFLSFHIFYSLLLFSTLIAVIVDSYSEVKREENAAITKFVLYKVQKAWSKIDPEGTGYIPYRQFWMFTAKLLEIYVSKDSLKTPKQSLNQFYSSRQKFLNDMSIPIYENQNGILCFQFHDVIEGLTRVYLQNNLRTPIKTKKAQKIFRQRSSAVFSGFKRSYYESSHVTTLLILKSGLRWWKNSSKNQGHMIKYKTMVSKFSASKSQINKTITYKRQNFIEPVNKSAFEYMDDFQF